MALKDEDFLLKQKETYDKKLRAMGIEIEGTQEAPFIDDLMDQYDFDPSALETPLTDEPTQEDKKNFITKLKKLWHK